MMTMETTTIVTTILKNKRRFFVLTQKSQNVWFISTLKGKVMAKPAKKGPVPHKILSDRGLHLSRCNETPTLNILHGQTAFMHPNSNGKDVSIRVGDKCPICRKKVRGLLHKDGNHHKGIVIKRSR